MKRSRKPDKSIDLFVPYISPSAKQLVIQILKLRLLHYGALAKRLEQQTKELLGFSNPLAVSSGTAALHLALSAAGIKSGDEVVTTPMTCVATNIPILYCRATPVFADIEQFSGNISPEDVERRITNRTKAILCVHFAGYPCDLGRLRSIADRYGLLLIEDSAQSIGARYKKQLIGTTSDFACFSFGRSKHVASGDGGLLVVRDPKHLDRAMNLRFYGFNHADAWPTLNQSPSALSDSGYKYDLNNFDAALILANMMQLDELIARRQEIAKKYRTALKKVPGLNLFESKNDRSSSHWMFMLHVNNRDGFTRKMRERRIQTWIVFLRNDHYDLFGGRRRDLPVLDQFEKTYTAIPCHNNLSDEDVDYVISTIREGW
jgi:perosamine synthetase